MASSFEQEDGRRRIPGPYLAGLVLLLSFDAIIMCLRGYPWLSQQIGYETIEALVLRRPGIAVAFLVFVHAVVLLAMVVQVFLARNRSERSLWISLFMLLAMSAFVAGVAYMQILKDAGWKESDGLSIRWN